MESIALHKDHTQVFFRKSTQLESLKGQDVFPVDPFDFVDVLVSPIPARIIDIEVDKYREPPRNFRNSVCLGLGLYSVIISCNSGLIEWRTGLMQLVCPLERFVRTGPDRDKCSL